MKSSKQKSKRVRPLLGTYVAIELHGDAEETTLQSSITAGFDAIADVERLMSYYRPDSDLSLLNGAKENKWLELHPLTLAVLRRSNELYHATGGRFDIRCGQTLAHAGMIPSLHGCQGACPKVLDGEPPVEINGNRVRKTGPWILDLGGIAKGFAVDQCVERIQSLDPEERWAGLVNAGGDLRIWGRRLFPVDLRIEEPENPQGRSLKLGQTAVATSAIRTEMNPGLAPAGHVKMPAGELMSRAGTTAVFADECYLADALTKVVLTASPRQAAQCLSAYGARAMIFRPDGNLQQVLQ